MKHLKWFALISMSVLLESCSNPDNKAGNVNKQHDQMETHEYFLLRPEAEKNYGYSHAVRIGEDLLISGAVSMDDAGYPTAVGDLAQQMKTG